jgi:hypothetical protein
VTIAIFGDALLDPATGETVREAVVVIEDGNVARAGVPGDPVADLSLLARPDNVRLVLKGGEVVKQA